MLNRQVLAAALCGAALVLSPGLSPAGDLEVTVSTADGKKFKSGVLYAGDQAIELKEGAGPIVVRNLTDRRLGIAVDLKVGQGLFKDDLRYLGVTESFPTDGTPAPVTVTAQPVPDIDAFCSGCHPSQGQPVAKGQIVRDIHVSGKELAERYRGQVVLFNRDIIGSFRKEGKERPPEPVVLDERVVKVGGKDVKKIFYTCESCHTLHWKTPWGQYARAEFFKRGTLCAGCHL